ncbi:MAG: TlpA disulfide reductase family protein, partial [bacterium]
VFFKMPVFDSEFRCKILDKKLVGNFYNHARIKNNILPFHAEMGLSYRFTDKPDKALSNITGRYHVIFDGEEEESKDVVGDFIQKGNHLTGTFLTTMGDYRYLEGEINGNRLWLSAFDGSHLFLFTAIIKNDSLVKGEFFSGTHWHDTWRGVKDENASLISPDSLAFLKPGYDKLEFTFPDENGKMVSLSDPQYKDKAMIIQLMGSWCPNCMDETKFLSGWYNSRMNKSIEIIALDFEKIVNPETASNNIKRLKNRFNIQYPVLFAGSSDKKIAVESLPMLNRIFAWPTTIFLDKNKKVIKIHSGFSGPATGKEYDKFIIWFERIVESLNN